ncbi:MAG: DNA gyrase subunit A, partial [Bacteroidales bacterium]|nr:DNA gyrase subunit A [Bacteroidales bacterium]
GTTRDEDFIEHIYVANMHSTMLFFTAKGMCYRIKVYELPEGTRTSKGRVIRNLRPIEADDSIVTYLNAKQIENREYTDSHYVVMVTRNGVIKKTVLTDYANARTRNKGITAIKFREGDELVEALLTDGNAQLMLAVRGGYCARFDEAQARDQGRVSSGVRGMRVAEGDALVGMIAYSPNAEDAADQSVLVVSEHGYGKRSNPEDYRLTARGSKGVKTLNITDKTGTVVAIKNVTEKNDLMIITRSGLTIRMSVADIKLAGRATQGVKLINIKDNDSIASVSVVEHGDDEEIPEAMQESAPEEA